MALSWCAVNVGPQWLGHDTDVFQKGLKEPYDWDEYAQCFFPKAEELVASAEEAERDGNGAKASELYL